jgi:hypothetical protein
MSPMKGAARVRTSEVKKEESGEVMQARGKESNCQEENFFATGKSNSVMLNAMLKTLREETKAQNDEKKPEYSQAYIDAQK